MSDEERPHEGPLLVRLGFLLAVITLPVLAYILFPR